jgi:hypothetical protein
MGTYIQLKYENNTLDEPVEISGMDFRVALKSDKGTLQAKKTTEQNT